MFSCQIFWSSDYPDMFWSLSWAWFGLAIFSFSIEPYTCLSYSSRTVLPFLKGADVLLEPILLGFSPIWINIFLLIKGVSLIALRRKLLLTFEEFLLRFNFRSELRMLSIATLRLTTLSYFNLANLICTYISCWEEINWFPACSLAHLYLYIQI